MIIVMLRKTQLKRISVLLCNAILFIAVLFITVLSLSPVVRATDSEDPIIMVSLGDSYSSGEGIEEFYGQEKNILGKVIDNDWLAHRSQNSWPGMLELTGVDGKMACHHLKNTHWYFVAASGAETCHLKNKQEKYYYKNTNPLVLPIIPISGTIPLKEQLDVFTYFELTGKVDYVTLTLGGNDADFGGVVTSAATSYKYYNPSGLFDKINDVWDRFFEQGGIRSNLEQAYKNIKVAAGEQAQIIVAGYPKLLNPSGSGRLFSEDNATLINNAVTNFNNEIKHLVELCETTGMKICFVSVEEEFDGHGAYSENPFISEVIGLSQSEDISDFLLFSNYSMHPNKEGAEAYAKCVQEKIKILEAEVGRGKTEESTASVTNPPVDNFSLIGDWLSNAGETVSFYPDGTFEFEWSHDNTIEKGTYSPDSSVVETFHIEMKSSGNLKRMIDQGKAQYGNYYHLEIWKKDNNNISLVQVYGEYNAQNSPCQLPLTRQNSSPAIKPPANNTTIKYYDSAKTIPAFDSACGKDYEDGFDSFIYSGYFYGGGTANSGSFNNYDTAMINHGFKKVDMSQANNAMMEIFTMFGIGDEMASFTVDRCYEKPSDFFATIVYIYSDSATGETLVVVMAL